MITLEKLTRREGQVLRMMISGMRAKNISQTLGITLRTVEVHSASIRQKTGATSPVQLGAMAVSTGWLAENPPTRIEGGRE